MLPKSWSRGAAVLGATAITVTSLAACSADPSPSSAEEGPRSLTLGVNIILTSWKPAGLYSNQDASLWWGAVYDTWLHCSPDGVPSPGAAESFAVNEDNTVLTLTTRDGMTFEDGTPVDAVAAKSSIEEMRDGGGSFAGQLAGLTVDIVDDRTVTVSSPEPRSTIASTLCLGAGIVSSPEALASPDVNSKPVSSGPYTLDEATTTSGSVWTFKKRDDYWDAESYPYETVVMKQMADVTARLNALKNGEIDGSTLDYTVAKEAEASGLTVLRDIGFYAGLHIADRAGTVVPALGDIRVRQAINMVFDREAILENIFQGEGLVSQQLMHPDSVGYVEELNEQYDYDIEAAKELMADAGYQDGFEVEIPASSTTLSINPMVVQQLAELNIRVKEVQTQQATYINDILSGRFPLYWFQMGTTPDSKFSVDYGFKIWNSFGATDPKLDEMIALTETLEGDEAAENYQEINRFWTENAWFATMLYTYVYTGVTSPELLPENTGPLGYPQLSDYK